MTIDKEVIQKYKQKKRFAKKDGIPMFLSLEEFCLLLEEAHISPNDIGIAKYHLSRYNDEGPYEYGNCRFIPYLENIREKKNRCQGMVTVKDDQGNNYKIYPTDPRYINGELVPIWQGKKHKEESKEIIGKKNSIHQQGEKNSQYGTCWVYNLSEKRSVKIKKPELDIYLNNGWKRGRKMNFEK